MGGWQRSKTASILEKEGSTSARSRFPPQPTSNFVCSISFQLCQFPPTQAPATTFSTSAAMLPSHMTMQFERKDVVGVRARFDKLRRSMITVGGRREWLNETAIAVVG
ncbi:unnamed protein product [Linum trigynum]|uniref:Uncharacterized protein n=1 Tax=Linum trigynum TaxID=586398 RepID=A0AAV2EAK7_9ROSI